MKLPLLLSLVLTHAAVAAQNQIIDLGAGTAAAINNSGHVLGSDGAGGTFFYDGGSVQPIAAAFPQLTSTLSDLLGASSGFEITTINDSDHLGGMLQPAIFVYKGGTSATKSHYPEYGVYALSGLNNSDVEAGLAHVAYFGMPYGQAYGFTADLSGSATDVSIPAIGLQLGGINDLNSLAGTAANGPAAGIGYHPGHEYGRAFILTNGVGAFIDARDSTLGGACPACAYGWDPAQSLSDAYGINNQNHVVGDMSVTNGGPKHAFIYTEGALRDLGTLGGISSTAVHINNNDRIVGSYTNLQGDVHAAFWANGQGVDLNTLLPAGSGWVLLHANSINDGGAIVGDGMFQGVQHAFLLPPPAAPPTNSTLAILHPTQTNSLTVVVQGPIGSQYRVEYVENLGSTNWQPLAAFTLTNAAQTVVDLSVATNRSRYYRGTTVP